MVDGLGELPSKAEGNIVAACGIFIVERTVLVEAIGEEDLEINVRLKPVRKLLGEVERLTIILFGMAGIWYVDCMVSKLFDDGLEFGTSDVKLLMGTNDVMVVSSKLSVKLTGTIAVFVFTGVV